MGGGKTQKPVIYRIMPGKGLSRKLTVKEIL
jgi:hypothetical protein